MANLAFERFIAGGVSSFTNVMTTDLNSLANGSTATASSALTNAAADMFADFFFTSGGALTPTTAGLTLYLLCQNGTTFVTVTASSIVGSAITSTSSATQVAYFRGILLPFNVQSFKPALLNNLGVAMTSSGNTLSWVTYNRVATST